jgi:hypothetical protein
VGIKDPAEGFLLASKKIFAGSFIPIFSVCLLRLYLRKVMIGIKATMDPHTESRWMLRTGAVLLPLRHP